MRGQNDGDHGSQNMILVTEKKHIQHKGNVYMSKKCKRCRRRPCSGGDHSNKDSSISRHIIIAKGKS